jgi:hypothetical protein
MKCWVLILIAVFSAFAFIAHDLNRSSMGSQKSPVLHVPIEQLGRAASSSSRKVNERITSNLDSADNLIFSLHNIKQNAEAGDAISQRQLAQILEECQGMSLSKNIYQDQAVTLAAINEASSKSYMDIASKMTKRCESVSVEMPSISNIEIDYWYTKSALNGDPVSTVEMLKRIGPETLSKSALEESIETVFASKDPEAIMKFADIAGSRLQGRDIVIKNLVGTKTHEYAWRIAACKIGAKCNAKSREVSDMCFYGGSRAACNQSYGLVDIYREEALTPDEMKNALRISNEVSKLFK